ncbi:ribonuclease H-like domain-containing protein [Tanacetum coccineum]
MAPSHPLHEPCQPSYISHRCTHPSPITPLSLTTAVALAALSPSAPGDTLQSVGSPLDLQITCRCRVSRTPPSPRASCGSFSSESEDIGVVLWSEDRKDFPAIHATDADIIKMSIRSCFAHTMGTHDDEARSSRTKRSRQHETVEEVLLPQVHHEFLLWEGCNKDAKSRYNTRLAQLLPRHVYSSCVMNWDVLNRMGYDGENDDMLRIRLRKAESNEEIFTYVAWIRAFNINEPIYVELCHEFYSTYEFDEYELQTKKIIKFRLGGRAHNLTLLESARRLGLCHADELKKMDLMFTLKEELHFYYPEPNFKGDSQDDHLWFVSKDDLMKKKGADLDTTPLRNLIDSEGRLIPEDPQPGVPRVGIPRPPRASMQDLNDRMGRMGIRQEAIERMEYRQSYHWDRLASSVLNGKSPFELVYGFKLKLSHLRSFGCLCFSSVLNNSDKFFANLNDDGRVYDTPYNDGNGHSCSSNADGCEDDFATSMGKTSTYKGNLDINNSFLYGDLSEDVYMTLPLGFDTDKSKFDYSLLTKNSDNVFIILLVYVDDIVVTGNNLNDIEKFKQFFKSKFQIKDLGKLKYFLGIEVLDNKYGIYLSQRKYCLELLHEFSLLAAKHADTPLPENATLNHIESDDDHFQYMHSPLNFHLDAVLRVLRYLKGSPGSGDSLVTWKSKKQSTLSRSSAEAEYRSMASATCKVIWLSNLLGDMGVKNLLPVVMYCDNSFAL